MQPDGKMSEMADTSGAVAYLLSTDSKYVSAHSLTVRGARVPIRLRPLRVSPLIFLCRYMFNLIILV